MPALFLGQEQSKLNYQRICRLHVIHQTPRRSNVLSCKRITNIICQRKIVSFLFYAPQDTGCASHQFGRTSKIGSCHQRMTGTRGARVLRGRGRVQPVAELKALIPEPLLAGNLGHPIHPGTHAFKLRSQNGCIAKALVEHPGNNHCGIPPGSGCHGRIWQYVRDDDRDNSIRVPLIGNQILQPGG